MAVPGRAATGAVGWWRLQHKAALGGAVMLAFWLLVAVGCEFVAPYDPLATREVLPLVPPQPLRIRDAAGQWHMPFVYGLRRARDPATLRLVYTEETSVRYAVRLFVQGDGYLFWGRWPANRHLFGLSAPVAEQSLFLLGTDRLGRDLFSRLCYGARVSLSLGLLSAALGLTLGLVLGVVAGYVGGLADASLQRLIEVVRSLPQIPLLMTLGAITPPHWSPLQVYALLAVTLALFNWTSIARAVRGRLLALREEDFVLAARFAGASQARIIVRHLLPLLLGYLVAEATLAVPGALLTEAGLSFIGLGLRAPAISWGLMLQEAQNLRSLSLTPWVLAPGLAVVAVTLACNALGEWLRDAAAVDA